jgi:hypothetical protein
MIMLKRAFLISISVLLLTLPFAAWAANVPAKIYENGADGKPLVQAGVKVEAFGGAGFKALLSSGESDAEGAILLGNLPLGRDVLVKLSREGYITQYDIRSYSEADTEEGVIFWTGSAANVTGLYSKLGEIFDVKKGHVYLEIDDELTGEGIEGIALAASSGKVFDLGQGEYLIANAAGPSVKIGITKPGYTFDIESATIPLYAGAMTQAYLHVQSGGAVYASGRVSAITSAAITGFIRRLSDAVGISGVTVAFTFPKGGTARPSVVTNRDGFYSQSGFVIGKKVKVTPEKPPFRFKPKSKTVPVSKKGAHANFKGR